MDLSLNTFEKIIDHLNDGLYLVDVDGRITYWSKAAERISGFQAGEVLGHQCSENILNHIDEEGNPLCLTGCPLKAAIQDGLPREADLYLHHKNGQRVPVTVRVAPLTDDQGDITGAAELFMDISNRKANEKMIRDLEKLALLDNLTQLANRTYLEREIRLRFEEMSRFQVPFGLIFMDIDHFKSVNDTFGHDTGDRVLKFVADTLVNSARAFDLFGRWGGEEFLGVIRNVRKEHLEKIAERIRLLVANAFIEIEKQKLSITLSLGASIADPGDTLDTLLKRADVLLYQSKTEGRNRTTLG